MEHMQIENIKVYIIVYQKMLNTKNIHQNIMKIYLTNIMLKNASNHEN